MDAATRELVRDRAGDCCEYCRLPQAAMLLIPFHVEHIIAKQHLHDDSTDNLAFACDRCNAFKGPNLSSIDPEMGGIVTLFHPRQDEWHDHFEIVEATIVGLTPTGRATAKLLQMNHVRRIQLRAHWIAENGGL